MDYAATEVMRSILSTSSPNKDSGSTRLVSSVPLSGKVSHSLRFSHLSFSLLLQEKNCNLKQLHPGKPRI